MKKIALTLWALLCCLLIHADNSYSLIVTFMDGNKVEYALADLPEISFGNDQMKVKTAKTEASFELWTVKTFTYSTSTGISKINNEKKMSIEGNTLVVEGTANNISCHSANGIAINLPHQTADGKTLISLDTLKQGIYLIKVNGKVIKIARQ